MNKPYIDEEGRAELCDLPDDYDQVMHEAHDHWENSGETRDVSEANTPRGSLEDRYEIYHDMAIACNEEPVSFDEWLN